MSKLPRYYGSHVLHKGKKIQGFFLNFKSNFMFPSYANDF